jgi:hypothetical protein
MSRDEAEIVDEDEDPFATVREIQQQLRLLQWRRVDTDERIKKAMMATKRQVSEDAAVAAARDRTGEKAAWVQKVIHEEMAGPLTVDAAYVRSFEAEEARDAAREAAARASQARLLKRAMRDAERLPPVKSAASIARLRAVEEELGVGGWRRGRRRGPGGGERRTASAGGGGGGGGGGSAPAL